MEDASHSAGGNAVVNQSVQNGVRAVRKLLATPLSQLRSETCTL